MTDRETIEAAANRWLQAYEKAWASNEPDDIRALFTEDADYATEPWVEPWSGHDEIVDGWIDYQDEADSYSFSGQVIAVDGTRAFIQGETVYDPDDEHPDGRHYRNLWVVVLDADGRASEFTEWYMNQTDD